MSAIKNRVDAFAVGLAKWVIAWRWLVIALSLVATAAVAGGGQYLGFATNYRVFFSDDNPELNAWEDFQDTYTRNDNILIVLEPSDGDVFSNDTLALVEKYTEIAWQTPFVLRVDSLSNFQHTYGTEEGLIVEDLAAGAADLSAARLAEIKDIALNEPLLVNQLVSPDARATAINIVLQYPDLSPREVPEAVAFVRNEIRSPLQAEAADMTIALSGVAMLNNAFSESGEADMGLIGLMFLIVFVAVMMAVRSFTGGLATMLVVMFSIPIGMGAAGYMGILLTPISFAATVIILTLAVADSIHILMATRVAAREGKSKLDAIVEGVRVNFLAVSITSLTTIIGFLALNFSDAPPFRHLGNITAVGIFAAWALSITMLPALLSLFPMKVKARDVSVAEAPSLMERLADFVIAHNKKLLVGVGAAALALVAMMPTLEFNDQWVEYFDARLEIRQDNDKALEHFGLYPVEYSLRAADSGGVSDPEYLEALDAFAEWLRVQPEVVHVYSISDIMKRLNKNLNADDPAFFRLPQERDQSAQYLLLYELSLPQGLDLNDRINIDKSASRLTATLTNATTTQTKDFLDRAEAWLADNAPQTMQTAPELHTQATGPQVMFTFVADRNIESMIRGNTVAVFAIALVMIFALRSFPLGMLSLIPNGLPILTTFGAWALLVGTVGFSVSAVAAVSLGIVVDDTVHFMTKYVRALRERGETREGAIRYAFKTVGAALVVNTVVLAIGFAVLTASTFKLNGDMGLLTALAIVFALILDFLLLPALLLMMPGEGKSASSPKSSEKGDPHADAVPA